MIFFYFIKIESQENIEIVIKNIKSEVAFKNKLISNILNYFKE